MDKNVNLDKYGYSGYGIEFNMRSRFSLPNGEFGKHVFIFDVDNSSSVHSNNRKNNILLLGDRLTDGLDNTTITEEAIYSIKINESRNKICLSLHYNGTNRFSYANAMKIY